MVLLVYRNNSVPFEFSSSQKKSCPPHHHPRNVFHFWQVLLLRNMNEHLKDRTINVDKMQPRKNILFNSTHLREEFYSNTPCETICFHLFITLFVAGVALQRLHSTAARVIASMRQCILVHQDRGRKAARWRKTGLIRSFCTLLAHVEYQYGTWQIGTRFNTE